MILDPGVDMEDRIKKIARHVITSRSHYCSFGMKTIDFFKLEHFKQLKVSTEQLITAIDVNFYFTS